MGLDYSYLLYFNRAQLWEVLEDIASTSVPSKLPTLIVFPDHILSLPMEGWAEKQRMVEYDAPEFGLMISMYFAPDEAIREYTQERHLEKYFDMADRPGIPIGAIYLTVYNDLKSFSSELDDPDHVLLEFGTPGTSISLLFGESASICTRFQELLEAYQGVCGILNREGPSEVIWLNGRRLSRQIENPFLPLYEIIELISNGDRKPV